MDYAIIITSLIGGTAAILVAILMMRRRKILRMRDNLDKIKTEIDANTKILQESNEELRKKEEAKRALIEAIEHLNQKFNETTVKCSEASKNFAQLTEAIQEASINEKEFIQSTIQRETAELEKEYARASLEFSEELKRNLKDVQEELNSRLEPLKAEVQTYENRQKEIIEAQKRELELKERQDFHRIKLSDAAIDDIKYIRSILGQVNKREVIAKVIWEAYLQVPTKEMINRVIGANKVTGVYRITDISTGECYVGQGTDVGRRLTEHVKGTLGIQSIADQRIHHIMAEKGLENWTFELLSECSKEELNSFEKYYINFYKSNEFGWNKTKGNGEL